MNEPGLIAASQMSKVHGGLDQPVNRIDVSAASKPGLQSIEVRDVDRTTLYRIADGTLSPLTGPMGITDFESVLETGAIDRDGSMWAWTIPIVLPVTDEEAERCQPGAEISLRDTSGEPFGTLVVSSCYDWDKEPMLQAIYKTDREDHPGARLWLSDGRTQLVGGDISLVPQVDDRAFAQRVMGPTQCRNLIEKRGWQQSVAFQTRNPLHRAHEYALVYGAESILRSTGKSTGVVLNPLVGELKGDDVPAEVRMATYAALIDDQVLGEGDMDPELWQAKGQVLKENLALVGLDMRMFYAGPSEAVMHAIYRQNLGFTHFIVGRKHADAPYDDKTPIWGDFDAQQVFENLGGQLHIKTVNVGFAAYFEEIERVGLVSENQGHTQVAISGSKVRELLSSGECPDPRIMREKTAQILVDYYAALAEENPEEPPADGPDGE